MRNRPIIFIKTKQYSIMRFLEKEQQKIQETFNVGSVTHLVRLVYLRHKL